MGDAALVVDLDTGAQRYDRWHVSLPGGVLNELHLDTAFQALWPVVWASFYLWRVVSSPFAVGVVGEWVEDSAAFEYSDEWYGVRALTHNALCGIDPQWLVSKGEYAGTWPKRLATYFRRNHPDLARGNKPLAEAIAFVGARLGESVNSGTRYDCDVTNALTWHAGDFGDSGSCYWGGNSDAIDLLVEHGAGAVRLYHRTGGGKARAWLCAFDLNGSMTALDECHEYETLAFVVWNAYGAATVTFARILAQILGWTYSKCAIQSGCDLVYVNGDAYVIHPSEATARTTYYMEIEQSCPGCGDSSECAVCENCSSRTCQCGTCGECDNSRCECACCSYCNTYNWCSNCERCHDCGRRPGGGY